MKIEIGGAGFCRMIELQSALRRFLALFCVALAVTPALAWEHWGGDPGGLRFSPLAQITPANVGNLMRAWEFRTGDLVWREFGTDIRRNRLLLPDILAELE